MNNDLIINGYKCSQDYKLLKELLDDGKQVLILYTYASINEEKYNCATLAKKYVYQGPYFTSNYHITCNLTIYIDKDFTEEDFYYDCKRNKIAFVLPENYRNLSEQFNNILNK